MILLDNIELKSWTKEELQEKMNEILNQIIESSQYGDHTKIQEEDSLIEVNNLQKTLKDSYAFLKNIYDNMPETGGDVNSTTPTRMRVKQRLDFDVN